MKRYKDFASDGGSNIVGQVVDQQTRLRSRLASVKHTVAVMSGKGGVGKSAVTVNLASALSLQGYRLGILDADINGPSIAKMTGIQRSAFSIQHSAFKNGLPPAIGFLGLRVISMDLFLPDEKTPVTWDAPTQKEAYVWRGTMEMTTLREFLTDTEWGDLDYLLIDLPPGTDRLPNIAGLLPQLSGTLILTIPSEVSQAVVKKSITLAKEHLKTPVIGLIENMKGYACPHCGNIGELFHSSGILACEEMAKNLGIPYLGSIPFDPRISLTTDVGKPFMSEFGDSPAAKAIIEIAEKIKTFIL
ncbi:Mrp/NBP35 family ATP-binding protein [candidate division TA06 bacterium]|nr:Mrp/NBP35 family ATP-binding protein [candidate division TA06 bacterium]